MRFSILVLSALFAIVLSGCMSPPKPQLTSLQLQAIQARDFETNKRTAFAAAMSVFQDLGYIIESANFDTGFITAKSPVKSGFDFQGTVMRSTKATAFIEEIKPNVTKIRLNFVNSEERSTDRGVRNVDEEAVEISTLYQNAFTKIQESIFVRTGFDNKAPAAQPSSEASKPLGN